MPWPSFHRFNSIQINRYAEELDQLFDDHLQWAFGVSRILLLGEDRSREETAHPSLACRFDEWYRRSDNAPLLQLPEFAAIGPLHEKVHAQGGHMLRQHAVGEALSPTDYDRWIQDGEVLRSLLRTVRSGLRRNLALTAQLMAKVFENASEGVMITAPDGMILTVNRAFTQITGYAAAEAVGNTPRILNSRRHDRHFYKHMWEKLSFDGTWQGEIWNRRKDDDIYLEWLSINPVRDDAGTITHYVAMFTDITTERESEERLYHLAHFDPLTGLPNRVLFRDRFGQALARAHRGQLKLAVAFLDLDGFKEVNDRHGHSVGDALLTQVAARLNIQLRKSDTVARLGGDEFGILLPDLNDTSGIDRVLHKVIDVVAQPFLLLDVHEIRITTSIGISIYPHDGEEAEALLRRADIAMYEAKRRGKNQYCLFDPSME